MKNCSQYVLVRLTFRANNLYRARFLFLTSYFFVVQWLKRRNSSKRFKKLLQLEPLCTKCENQLIMAKKNKPLIVSVFGLRLCLLYILPAKHSQTDGIKYFIKVFRLRLLVVPQRSFNVTFLQSAASTGLMPNKHINHRNSLHPASLWCEQLEQNPLLKLWMWPVKFTLHRSVVVY